MPNKYNTSPRYTRYENLRLAQEGTIRDLKKQLETYQIALMVRPTGFGKTYTMIKLCESERYSHVLYMYPRTVIMNAIFQDYHSQGVDKYGNSKFKFAATEEEHRKYPELPFIEFVSYSKMLIDWNNAKELMGIPDSKWDKATDAQKLNIRIKWITKRFSDIDLLILDEAHMTGANGFLEYWPYLHKLASNRNQTKANRLHIVGATATPLRTNVDVDIEKDIFYCTRGKKRKSAKIPDFGMTDCWACGILQRPVYTKGILDIDDQREFLKNELYENMLGSKSSGYEEFIGRDTKAASKVKIVSAPYLDRQRKLYEQEISLMNERLDSALSPKEVIYDGIMTACPNKIKSDKYMRFLVFYQNTEDMIRYHEQINKALLDAVRTGDPNKYPNVRINYIVTNEKAMEEAGIPVSPVEILDERNDELSGIRGKDGEIITPYDSTGQLDIVHSIDILTMGYHVGEVTGVIIKTATGSEIKYYQKLGRCMSVTEDSTPLIIDFCNADAELYRRTADTLREEAVKRIQEFIGKCTIHPDAKELNKLYSSVRMNVGMDYIPNGLIEHYYFDRKSPIYFIKGIAESQRCDEGISSIVHKIYQMCLDRYSVDEFKSDKYAIGQTRLEITSKGGKGKLNALGKLITETDKVVNDILDELDGGEQDA